MTLEARAVAVWGERARLYLDLTRRADVCAALRDAYAEQAYRCAVFAATAARVAASTPSVQQRS